jgi:hypothetical protein
MSQLEDSCRDMRAPREDIDPRALASDDRAVREHWRKSLCELVKSYQLRRPMELGEHSNNGY